MKHRYLTRLEAAMRGRACYGPTQRCKRGHRAERRVLSGTCVVCAREAAQKYKRKLKRVDPAKLREIQRKASARHRSKLRRLIRAARETNCNKE